MDPQNADRQALRTAAVDCLKATRTRPDRRMLRRREMPALQRHCDDGQQMSSQLLVPTPSGMVEDCRRELIP